MNKEKTRVGQLHNVEYSKNCLAIRFLKRSLRDVNDTIPEVEDEIQTSRNRLLSLKRKRDHIVESLNFLNGQS